MPVKYHCLRCGKRYVEWGAEKLGFKCPDCEGEELVRIGGAEDKGVRKTSLKRTAKKSAEASGAVDEDEALVPDTGALEESDADEAEDEDEAAEGQEEGAYDRSDAKLLLSDNDDSSDVSIDVSDGLPFGEVSPGLGDDSSLGEGEDVGDWKG